MQDRQGAQIHSNAYQRPEQVEGLSAVNKVERYIHGTRHLSARILSAKSEITNRGHIGSWG